MIQPTKPVRVEGELSAMASWQSPAPTWSFGDSERRLFAPPMADLHLPNWAEDRNREAHATFGPQRIDVPSRRVESSPRPRYGQRSLRALYQWEGIVEEVTADGFRARLVPLMGPRERGRFEFTEFSFDDLSTEDRERVEPGASFYWTLGKDKNDAGVVTNQSLVRFRKLAPMSRYRRMLAEKEAEGLLEELSGNGAD